MFPFPQNDQFSSQIFSDPHQDIIQENPILGQDSLDSSHLTNLMEQPPVSNSTNNDEKKIVRKEIERQRRQQMSTLHASLRSLLPLESLKGKRSMSDHINEAAKYIKHLQNNVRELSVKRDKLKNFSDSPFLKQGNYEGNLKNSTVSVRSHLGGFEIVTSSSAFGEESCLLSRVLEAIVEEGFDVISLISTKRDRRSYNTIQCQATHLTCIDLAALQQKLNDVILSS